VSFEWQEERRELHARLKAARDAINAVLETVNWDVFDLCDCGHRRVDHKRVVTNESVYDACSVSGCPCVDFDDSDVQHRHHLAREKRQPLRAVEGSGQAA
jgi:hypothetical protein